MKKQVTVVLQAADGELGLWGVFDDSEKAEKSIALELEGKNEEPCYTEPEEAEARGEDYPVDVSQGFTLIEAVNKEAITNTSKVIKEADVRIWGYMIADAVQ